MIILFSLLLPFLGTAPAAMPEGLDVNDVSVLFPFSTRGQPFPEITLAEGSRAGTLLPGSALDSLMAGLTAMLQQFGYINGTDGCNRSPRSREANGG